MSSDSFVLKIVEYNTNMKEQIRTYVFYDHNLEMFGIRGGYVSKNDNNNASHSLYCSNLHDTREYLKLCHNDYDNILVCLVNFDDLSRDSDNITFDQLYADDFRKNEVFGFDYGRKVFNFLDITPYLNVLMNVYNNY